MKRLSLFVLFLRLVWSATVDNPTAGGQLRVTLRSEPKTFDPILVNDESSSVIRHLTGGTLVRLNRRTQQIEPALARSWSVSPDSRQITFQLRAGVTFSDGSSFSSADVASTLQRLIDPATHAPAGEEFRAPSGNAQVTAPAPDRVSVRFPQPVAGPERLFESVAIQTARLAGRDKAVLGPFQVAEYKPGAHVLLTRNPRYWKRDEAGRQLPYLASIRLDIQQNRDLELMRFRRGELDLISSLDPEAFQQLSTASKSASDLGPSLDSENLYFNLKPDAPIAPEKKEWFQQTAFRRAIAEAMNRADLARVVYRGHALAAPGPIAPSNQTWFNRQLPAPIYDPAGALRRLQAAGFRRDGTVLRDRSGRPVEFTLLTCAGCKTRERIAAMIEQDLSHIGIRTRIVTLDFASLLDRITRSFQYDTLIIGLAGTPLDPSEQMDTWRSSGVHHQWNPMQKSPATAWEAEIDRLLASSGASPQLRQRKAAFDRIQEILVQEAPMIPLIYKNSLVAISPSVTNVEPSILFPQLLWNAERIIVQRATP